MEKRLQIILTALCGILGLAGWLTHNNAVALAAVVCGSPFALRSTFISLRDREIDVNFLMMLAALGSVVLGKLNEAAALLFLFSLSNTLEAFAMGRTQSAIEGLMKLRPDTALVVTESGDVKTPVKDLQVGQVVRVVPFAAVPADGTIIQGDTSVNEAAMTGESVPVTKSPGDRLLAGTQNQDGMVTMTVTHAMGDTTLEKIVHLVRDAQENKASGERISQWFGSRYTIFVVAVFVVDVAVRLAMQQPINEALYRSFTLLVALSPCALVISTPATTLSALAWAARKGILVRGGQHIESAGKATTILLDKTGTLTQGRFELREICVCHTAEVGAARNEDACWMGGPMGPQAQELLLAAAAAEQYSTHPIAEAIVRAARAQGLAVPECPQQTTVPGFGVVATVDGHEIKIGQERFFTPDELPEGFHDHIRELQESGLTTAVARYRGEFAALAMGDMLRPEAVEVLSGLRRLGVNRVAIMTGDSPPTAKAVGKSVRADEVHAALMPEDKERLVAEAAAKGETVMMVGDGVNDAPSLARAHVGVAMGGLGSDIALNAADVVLMRDRLTALVDLVRLGRTTERVVRANLLFASGMIVFLAVGSVVAETYFPAWSSALLPIAVFGHEGSTVLVILNGLRLLGGPGRLPS